MPKTSLPLSGVRQNPQRAGFHLVIVFSSLVLYSHKRTLVGTFVSQLPKSTWLAWYSKPLEFWWVHMVITGCSHQVAKRFLQIDFDFCPQLWLLSWEGKHHFLGKERNCLPLSSSGMFLKQFSSIALALGIPVVLSSPEQIWAAFLGEPRSAKGGPVME